MWRFIIIILLFISAQTTAHQPKLIYGTPSKNSPYLIESPEISKAFYGKLTGEPHYFKIETNKNFLFYAFF